MIKEIIYGLGGYDETKPDNNVVEVVHYTAEEEAQLEAEAQAAAAKVALFERLGITEEEAKLLLS